ncbi:hypothetical protein [Bradyrhizobium genosp. L]|uniref:hypothetical protein n=1 Tax=Bradyrhizobium genosp. L TaxID=83637 RepID=UPI001FEE0BE3|nr:hypothetical protein [Bradyrhizobium genosp. L]
MPQQALAFEVIGSDAESEVVDSGVADTGVIDPASETTIDACLLPTGSLGFDGSAASGELFCVLLGAIGFAPLSGFSVSDTNIG